MDFSLIYQWLDVGWIFIGLLILHKGQRLKATFFILSCVLALRLQIELMRETGHPTGFLPFLDFPLLERGYITYGIFIALFLILSHYSSKDNPYVYMAAAITVFMVAFCVSTFVLVL